MSMMRTCQLRRGLPKRLRQVHQRYCNMFSHLAGHSIEVPDDTNFVPIEFSCANSRQALLKVGGSQDSPEGVKLFAPKLV